LCGGSALGAMRQEGESLGLCIKFRVAPVIWRLPDASFACLSVAHTGFRKYASVWRKSAYRCKLPFGVVEAVGESIPRSFYIQHKIYVEPSRYLSTASSYTKMKEQELKMGYQPRLPSIIATVRPPSPADPRSHTRVGCANALTACDAM
jgi:hypothetical protein